MFETYNSSGYDLYRPDENTDHWVFDDRNNIVYRGKLKEVVQYMVQRFDFYLDDVLDGLDLLANNVDRGDNCIHYGVYKTAIFTTKKEVNYERAS